mgnify:CR=1 FL=1
MLFRSQLTNEDYAILTYVGIKPEAIELGIVPQSKIEWIRQIIVWGHDITGFLRSQFIIHDKFPP